MSDIDDAVPGPLISIEWLLQKLKEHMRRGRYPTTALLERVQPDLEALAQLFNKSRGARKQKYPLHEAAEVLRVGANKALTHWRLELERTPANKLAEDALRDLQAFLQLLEARFVDYMELSRPPDQGPTRKWIAQTCGVSLTSIKSKLDGLDDHLADQTAAIFENLLREAGNKSVGLSSDGPVAKLTADVMVRAGWTGTTAARVKASLTRKNRSKRKTAIVPDQNSNG